MLRQSDAASESHMRSIARHPESRQRSVSFIGDRIGEETSAVTTTYENSGGGVRTFMQKHPRFCRLRRCVPNIKPLSECPNMLHRRRLFTHCRNSLASLAAPLILLNKQGYTFAQTSSVASTGKFSTMPFDDPPFGEPPLIFGKRSGPEDVYKNRPRACAFLIASAIGVAKRRNSG